jgi:hypothetical protein
LPEQRALLGVSVLTRDDLGGHLQLRLIDHRRLARQRPARPPLAAPQPMLARLDAVAIEHLDSIARQPGTQQAFIARTASPICWAVSRTSAREVRFLSVIEEPP